MQAPTQGWLPSGKSRPCPICGRTKDGDCRISGDGLAVICHKPKDLKPGTVEKGWAFTGNTSDGRAGNFTINKPRSGSPSRPGKVVPGPAPCRKPRKPYRSPAVPPAGAPPPDLGRATAQWCYRDASGQQLFWIQRLAKGDGNKAFVHRVWLDGGWHFPSSRNDFTCQWPSPRPLYGLPQLQARPADPVLVAEGEKAADAAARLLPSHVPVSWSGGCTRHHETDWSPLAGRTVVLWPDHDAAGRKAMADLGTRLLQFGCSVTVVHLADDFPDGWDLADANFGPERAAELLALHSHPVEAPQQQAQQAKGSTATGRSLRLSPADVLGQLPRILGTIRQNARTGDVLTQAGILTGNQISRLYLQLSNGGETWPKEATADAVMYLAGQNTYDPVAEYLDGITAAPLPLEQWNRLDQHLLGINDPIAARFLPRFLISAVARTMQPGCYVRQSPVLVGPQERGKSELGRILFGADHWVEGVGKLDRDALQRAHTAWGVELAELDGVTRRRDQEQLKAFLTETCDTYQIRYDRHPERHPRRFVFWGSANRPPLRDSTGSTRFVIIPVPDQMLPLDWARQHRDALWARALEQYRSGVTWLRTDEQERQEVEARNADFIERDPWADQVAALLASRITTDTLPVKVPEILQHLGVPVERQTNETAKRVSAIAELNGWRHGRRTVKGQKLQGLWPGHPGHPQDTPRGVRENASDANGSQQSDTPDTPISVKRENKGDRGNRQQAATGTEMHAGGSAPFSGCPGCPPKQTHCSATPAGVSGGCPSGCPSGCPRGVHPPTASNHPSWQRSQPPMSSSSTCWQGRRWREGLAPDWWAAVRNKERRTAQP